MTITLVEIDGNVQADSSTSLAIGTGTKTFTLDSAEPFIVGMTVTVRYDDSNDMTGSVTKVSGTSLTVNVTSVNGSGTYAAWEINGDRTIYLATETYVPEGILLLSEDGYPLLTEEGTALIDSSNPPEYIGDIVDPGNIEQYMFSNGTTLGKSKVAKGSIVVNNKDGAWDFLQRLGYAKGSIRIKQIANASEAFVPVANVFAGTVVYPEVGFHKVDIGISDRLEDLDVPAQVEVFAGTNSGATGIEGNEGGIKGQVKPFGLGGEILGVKAKLLNESKNIYGVMFDYAGATDAITGFGDIMDEGLVKTVDTGVGTAGDVANLAALQAATITAGQVITCNAEGLFRFSGKPNGIVTCNFTEASRTGADIVKQLLERIGLTSSEYVGSTFTAVDSANGDYQELFVEDDSAVLPLAVHIMNGMGGYIISDTDNKIRVGLLTDPSLGTSVKTFDQYTAIDLSTLSSRDPGNGLPPRQFKLLYNRNYTPFSDSEFAGAVTDTARLLYGNKWRERVGVDNAKIARKHPNAPIFVIETHFLNETDADTELSRQETLRQTERNFYQFSTYDLEPLNLGDVITLEIEGRFDLSAGKKVTILGKEINLRKSRTLYTVWG